MNEKKYWNRILSCGHNRFTNIAFISRKYDKPKIGDSCYCRTCFNEVEIIDVKEASKKDYEEIVVWDDYFKSLSSKEKTDEEK